MQAKPGEEDLPGRNVWLKGKVCLAAGAAARSRNRDHQQKGGKMSTYKEIGEGKNIRKMVCSLFEKKKLIRSVIVGKKFDCLNLVPVCESMIFFKYVEANS